MKPTAPIRSPSDPADTAQERVRTLFEDACSHLDNATLARLREARLHAVSARHRRALMPVLLPAGALAAGLLALVVAWRPLHTPHAVATTAAVGTLPVNADSREIDMAQNLDFYDWLASQSQSAPAVPASAQ